MSETSIAALEPRLQKLVESARAAFERGNRAYTIELCRDVLAAAPGCLSVRKLQRTALLQQDEGRRRFFAKFCGGVAAAPFLFRGSLTLARESLKALMNAQRALEVDPHSVASLRLLGRAALALGWNETAAFAFDALCEAAPRDLAARISLGRAHLAVGRGSVAVECAEAALRLDPTHGEAQALLKDASVAQSLRQGRWEEAGDFRAKMRPGT